MRFSDGAAGWVPGEELPIPSNLEELVHERVDRLGAPGLEVARVVAALADPTVRLVEAAAGRLAEAGLRDAIEARILEVDGERLRFTHPLLRSAVSSRATPAQRRSLHARLAQVAPSTEERARHLALAAVRPSREVAAVVEEAAESVHARGAAAAAAELAELAVRLTPADDVEACAGASSTAPIGSARQATASRAIALLEQARDSRSSGAGAGRGPRAPGPTLWRSSSARAKRSTSIARRSPRLKATRPSRRRFTSTSPRAWSRRTGIAA